MFGVTLLIIASQILVFAALLAYLLTGRLTLGWVDTLLMHFFGIKLRQHQKFASSIDPRTKLIASNHRSFADFFIDSALAGYVTHLSRWMVAAALPCAAIYAFFTGRVLFFKRGKTQRVDLETKMLGHQKNHPFPTIFYPEQHRSTAPDSLPLRHGVLKICYENRLPIQMMIASNKEKIFNEKTGEIRWNLTSHFGTSAPIFPEQYEDYSAFYQAFEAQWLELWQTIYHPKEEDFQPYQIRPPKARFHYTRAWLGFWGIFLLFFLSYYGVSNPFMV